MKAFLLAAGEGRRLRPLTDSIPKCLVPIRGVPLLGIWLQLLDQHGISDVLVNTHYLHAQVEGFLQSWRARIDVKTVHEERLLGSAGTLLANRGFVTGEESFLILYADNLTTVDLGRMLRFHRDHAETLTLAVAPTDTPTEKGTVRLDSRGRVVEFAEKSPSPPSNLASAGMYVARQRLFDYLPAALPAGDVLDFGYDVLPRMVPNIAAYRMQEFLLDIGTPDSYAAAQETWPGLTQNAV